jgi:hypothetical protein
MSHGLQQVGFTGAGRHVIRIQQTEMLITQSVGDCAKPQYKGGVLLNAVRSTTCTADFISGSSTLFRGVMTYTLAKLYLSLLPLP